MCLPSLRSVEAVSAFSAVHHAFPNLFGHRTHYPSHTIHRMGDMQSQVASAVGVIQSGLHVCFVSKSTGSTGAFEFSQSWDTCPSRQQTVGRGIPAPQARQQTVGRGYLAPQGNRQSLVGYLHAPHDQSNRQSVVGYLPPQGNRQSVVGYLAPQGNRQSLVGCLAPQGNRQSVVGYRKIPKVNSYKCSSNTMV